MKWKVACWLLASSLTCAFTTNALAVPVLDQEQTTGESPFRLATSRFWQQGVKAGKSGLLSEVEVYYNGNLKPVDQAGGFQFLLNLADMDGNPFGPTIFSETRNLTPSVDAGWINFNVSSANYDVVADVSIFYIGLLGVDSPGANNPNVFGSQAQDPYSRGILFENGVPNGSGLSDLRFRTYVDQSVPEPDSLILLALGLVALGFLSKRVRSHCSVPLMA